MSSAFADAADLPARHPEHVEGAPLSLVDARGWDIAHALFGADIGEPGGLCWNGGVPDVGPVRSSAEGELLLTWPDARGPEPDGLCVLAGLTHSPGPPRAFAPPPGRSRAFSVAGRAGSDVASVFLELPGGETVTPTFEDGLFLAWWPGPIERYAVVGLDANGKRIAVVLAHEVLRGEGCPGS